MYFNNVTRYDELFCHTRGEGIYRGFFMLRILHRFLWINFPGKWVDGNCSFLGHFFLFIIEKKCKIDIHTRRIQIEFFVWRRNRMARDFFMLAGDDIL